MVSGSRFGGLRLGKKSSRPDSYFCAQHFSASMHTKKARRLPRGRALLFFKSLFSQEILLVQTQSRRQKMTRKWEKKDRLGRFLVFQLSDPTFSPAQNLEKDVRVVSANSSGAVSGGQQQRP